MKLGIATQLVVPFVCICAVIVTLLGVGLLSAVSNILSSSLDEKSRCLVRTTASELRGPLLLGEDMHAQTILEMAMKLDHDLTYVIITGPDGTQLCSKVSPGATPLPFSPPTDKGTDGGYDVFRREGPDGRAFEMDASIEISGEKAGSLRMGFTSTRIEQQMRAAQWWIAGMGTISLILGSTAYLMLISASILRPIGTVVATSARIAEGDVGETVEVKRKDEIGDMLNAMNRMVLYLREMSDAADAIAGGDLGVHVNPRSSADRFGNALNKMVASLDQATRELITREGEARKLAAIVQSSHDAIISVELGGSVISWNAGAQALLGYSARDIIGKSLDVLVSDGQQSQLYKVLAEQTGSSTCTLETNLLRKDGSSVEVSMTLSPVLGDNGEHSSYAVIARDVTDKRLVERRLREFYSMISHELRTPLTSIRGGLALIAERVVRPDSDDGMKLVELAQSSCIRLIRLINHILDIRKIEDGKINLELQTIEAHELVRRSVEEMEAFAYERGVKLKIGQTSQSTLLVDTDRIVQVLTNLISNAVKYSSSGQEVEISVFNAANHDALKFAVNDNGEGISPANQSKLFQQFQQVDSSDSRAKEGSGLGLFISKAIIEEHRGVIGVDSKIGSGSTFWFEIPVAIDGAFCQQSEQPITDGGLSCNV